jgi:dsDNA-specific endonuclease/ATPase MutS2
MRFEIGSLVSLIDDVFQGKVISLKDEMIEIMDEDGMTYTYHQSELVLVNMDQHELTKFTDINHPLLKEKARGPYIKTTPFRKDKNEVVFEVDLHINELVENTRNLDNYDMLNLQLDTAKRKLEYAISQRFSKVIFIHGIGEGVLKRELQYLLKKYPVDFYDASYQKYGLGATEVYIYQNPKS